MCLKNIFIISIVFLTCENIYTQINSKPDSIKLIIEKDTINKTEYYTQHGNFKKFIYRAFFKPIGDNSIQNRVIRKLKIKTYSAFNGKIIRQNG